ncbi:MAG: yehU 7 [Mucilaginibacter sp.]|nr:yehU 7 [Mucilaginibacter sp.]
MKIFRKYIFPPIFGLLIYFTLRLLHDTDTDTHFWRRSWTLNSIEMGFSILTGYAGIYLFERLFKYFDSRWSLQFSYHGVVRELTILVFSNLILVNLIMTPMVALTDDGLSWADFVEICMIPTLYAVIYYGIARSSTYMKAYVDNKIKLEKVTNDHLETELKFLKSQYHPHFLFNALNTIYFQMDDDLPGAKNSIEKFSELLRYQLYDQQHQVPVINEIEYLQSFIDLQKIRSSDKLQMEVSFDKCLKEQLVYPLLFLPLVENAFKFIGGNYSLIINARLADDEIIFNVENSVPSFEQPVIRKGGIGLENLKRRLDLLYPQKHQLCIKITDETYSAELKFKYE